MTENHDYYPGQKLSWYHGHAYLKVVKVLEVEPDRVRVQGMSSTYWIRKTTLERAREIFPWILTVWKHLLFTIQPDSRTLTCSF